MAIKSIWFEGARIYMRSEDGSLYSRPLEAFPRLLELRMRNVVLMRSYSVVVLFGGQV